MGTYLIQSCEVCGALLHHKDVSLHAEWHRKTAKASGIPFREQGIDTTRRVRDAAALMSPE